MTIVFNPLLQKTKGEKKKDAIWEKTNKKPDSSKAKDNYKNTWIKNVVNRKRKK